jgi:hypothetical protein
MRWVVYWSVVVAVAVMVAHAAATPREAAEMPLASGVLERQVSTGEGRAILLGVGILAIAYTYQRAWLNWRGSRG